MKRSRRAAAVAALGVALVAWAAVSLFDIVDEEVDAGPRGEALRDPLLAARRLLVALGVPSETRPGIAPLPPAGHVLLLLTPERSLSLPEGERLLSWVERGGRLVATPQSPLLEPLGLDAVTVEGMSKPEVVAIEVEPGRALQVELRAGRRLLDPEGTAEHLSGPQEGLTLLRVRHGDGLVTFVPERRFAENRQIGRHQHGALLWALVAADGVPAGARLIGGFERPELVALLVRRAGPALLTGGLLLLAWAARRSARFGPLLPDPRVDRRSLLDHVRATGDFLWRKDRGADLVASVRRGLERAAAKLHPGWDRLPPEDRLDRLAAASGLAPTLLEESLADPASGPAPQSFTRRIQILEQVRRSL